VSRSLPRSAALVLALSLSIVVAEPAASNAGGGPGVEVGPASASANSVGSVGRGLGVTGALPIDAQALATAKQHANARALGNDRFTGGGPVVGTSGWSGGSDGQVAPPDTTGAIGPSSYVELINLRYAIYSRTGTLVSSGPLESITGTSHTCLSDPQIIWDADGQRFFYAALDVCNNTFDVGFSRSSTPTGGGSSQWCQYSAFQYGSLLPDFPKLGDSRDFLMIGSNVFQNLFLTYAYVRSDVAWINKNDLYVDGLGNCSYSGIRAGVFQGLTASNGNPASTPVPANGVEYGDPTGYVVADPDASSQPNGTATYLSLFHVTADANGAATLSAPTTLSVPGFKVPASAPQKGTKKKLDTSDGRLTQAVAAYDPSEGRVAVWTQHSVFGGAGAEVRWYEIAGDDGTVLDSGNVTSPSLYAFNAAISPDRAVPGATGAQFGASMALTFSTSASSTFSAIQLVTKPASGVQSGFTKIVQSPGRNVDFSCSSVCRWGDYSGASPDPVAGTTGGTVWLANQWNVKSLTGNDVDWRTWIFNTSF
jgi:hypothetical protein